MCIRDSHYGMEHIFIQYMAGYLKENLPVEMEIVTAPSAWPTVCLLYTSTEAIALGHDLGHTPFGHSGEAILNVICEDGFTHYEQSVRVVEKLEKNGKGLNLTWEVRDGIRNHRTCLLYTSRCV